MTLRQIREFKENSSTSSETCTTVPDRSGIDNKYEYRKGRKLSLAEAVGGKVKGKSLDTMDILDTVDILNTVEMIL